MNQNGDLHFQSVFDYDDPPPPPPPEEDEILDFNYQNPPPIENSNNNPPVSNERTEILNKLKNLDPSELVVVCI